MARTWHGYGMEPEMVHAEPVMHHASASFAVVNPRTLSNILFIKKNICLARIMLWNRRALLHRN